MKNTNFYFPIQVIMEQSVSQQMRTGLLQRESLVFMCGKTLGLIRNMKVVLIPIMIQMVNGAQQQSMTMAILLKTQNILDIVIIIA